MGTCYLNCGYLLTELWVLLTELWVLVTELWVLVELTTRCLTTELPNEDCKETQADVVVGNSVMAFAGPGPEVTNGRLAMLGFVAAAGAEVATGFTAIQQLSEAPVLIGLTFLVFIAASLVSNISHYVV